MRRARIFIAFLFMLVLFPAAADSWRLGRPPAETVATGFVQGLIENDAAKVRSLCFKPYGNQAYEDRLNEFLSTMSRVAAKQAPPHTLPKAIERVFAVRLLSAKGPEAYGYALFGSRRVGFVDVEVRWDDGMLTPYRMLMILDANAEWNVYPFPDVSPLLSAGLHEETASTVEFERGASKP